jgi:biopolymer transport protein ExbB
MVAFFQKGGPMMWGLLVLSIIGLAFIIERFITLYGGKARVSPRKFVEQLIALIETKGFDAALELCQRTPAPVAKILGAALEKRDKGRAVIEETITAAGTTELAFLDRGMLWLSMVATLAPIIGFLGTVAGMISAFEAVARVGEMEPTVVASGISEALITTATGLAIAAPVVLFHTLFTTKIDGYSRDMEESATMLVDNLIEKGYTQRGK